MKSRGKILFGISVIVFAVFAVLFTGCSSMLQAGDNEPVMSTAELSNAYKQAVVSPLNKAGSEIKDPQIAQFYQKLLQSYELEKTNENSSGDGSAGLANLLPDLKKINKAALDLPLKEAGKQIKDKEIAEFYHGFISGIGVDK